MGTVFGLSNFGPTRRPAYSLAVRAAASPKPFAGVAISTLLGVSFRHLLPARGSWSPRRRLRQVIAGAVLTGDGLALRSHRSRGGTPPTHAGDTQVDFAGRAGRPW